MLGDMLNGNFTLIFFFIFKWLHIDSSSFTLPSWTASPRSRFVTDLDTDQLIWRWSGLFIPVGIAFVTDNTIFDDD